MHGVYYIQFPKAASFNTNLHRVKASFSPKNLPLSSAATRALTCQFTDASWRHSHWHLTAIVTSQQSVNVTTATATSPNPDSGTDIYLQLYTVVLSPSLLSAGISKGPLERLISRPDKNTGDSHTRTADDRTADASWRHCYVILHGVPSHGSCVYCVEFNTHARIANTV